MAPASPSPLATSGEQNSWVAYYVDVNDSPSVFEALDQLVTAFGIEILESYRDVRVSRVPIGNHATLRLNRRLSRHSTHARLTARAPASSWPTVACASDRRRMHAQIAVYSCPSVRTQGAGGEVGQNRRAISRVVVPLLQVGEGAQDGNLELVDDGIEGLEHRDVSEGEISAGAKAKIALD